MTNNISWFESKTVWFNGVLTLIGTATLLQGTFPHYAPLFVLIGGIGNLILRIWFTSTSIAATPTATQ